MNNPLSKNIIIDFEDRDWRYEIKKPDGTINTFFIMSNKGGYKWLELWGNIDDYDSLVAYITNLSDATILENNTERKHLKYHRNHCDFSLQYIEYVDLWIDPNWDGDPYIEFAFVSKKHPQFKTYAFEALALCEIIETNLQKRRTL